MKGWESITGARADNASMPSLLLHRADPSPVLPSQSREVGKLHATQDELETNLKIARSNLALAENHAEALEDTIKRTSQARLSNGHSPNAPALPSIAGSVRGQRNARNASPTTGVLSDTDTDAIPSPKLGGFWRRKAVPTASSPNLSALAAQEEQHIIVNGHNASRLSKDSTGSSFNASRASYAESSEGEDQQNLMRKPSFGMFRNASGTFAASTSGSTAGNAGKMGVHERNQAAAQINALRSQLQSLERAHETLQNEHTQLQTNFNNLNTKYMNLQEEIENLSVSLFEEANTMVAEERRVNSFLNQQLDKAKEEAEALQKEIEELRASKAAAPPSDFVPYTGPGRAHRRSTSSSMQPPQRHRRRSSIPAIDVIESAIAASPSRRASREMAAAAKAVQELAIRHNSFSADMEIPSLPTTAALSASTSSLPGTAGNTWRGHTSFPSVSDSGVISQSPLSRSSSQRRARSRSSSQVSANPTAAARQHRKDLSISSLSHSMSPTSSGGLPPHSSPLASEQQAHTTKTSHPHHHQQQQRWNSSVSSTSRRNPPHSQQEYERSQSPLSQDSVHSAEPLSAGSHQSFPDRLMTHDTSAVTLSPIAHSDIDDGVALGTADTSVIEKDLQDDSDPSRQKGRGLVADDSDLSLHIPPPPSEHLDERARGNITPQQAQDPLPSPSIPSFLTSPLSARETAPGIPASSSQAAAIAANAFRKRSPALESVASFPTSPADSPDIASPSDSGSNTRPMSRMSQRDRFFAAANAVHHRPTSPFAVPMPALPSQTSELQAPTRQTSADRNDDDGRVRSNSLDNSFGDRSQTTKELHDFLDSVANEAPKVPSPILSQNSPTFASNTAFSSATETHEASHRPESAARAHNDNTQTIVHSITKTRDPPSPARPFSISPPSPPSQTSHSPQVNPRYPESLRKRAKSPWSSSRSTGTSDRAITPRQEIDAPEFQDRYAQDYRSGDRTTTSPRIPSANETEMEGDRTLTMNNASQMFGRHTRSDNNAFSDQPQLQYDRQTISSQQASPNTSHSSRGRYTPSDGRTYSPHTQSQSSDASPALGLEQEYFGSVRGSSDGQQRTEHGSADPSPGHTPSSKPMTKKKSWQRLPKLLKSTAAGVTAPLPGLRRESRSRSTSGESGPSEEPPMPVETPSAAFSSNPVNRQQSDKPQSDKQQFDTQQSSSPRHGSGDEPGPSSSSSPVKGPTRWPTKVPGGLVRSESGLTTSSSTNSSLNAFLVNNGLAGDLGARLERHDSTGRASTVEDLDSLLESIDAIHQSLGLEKDDEG